MTEGNRIVSSHDGKNTSNSRYKCFSYLQEKYGIDCEIVLGDLSEYEAIIYEQALKLHMLNNGEVLLNVEGIPSVYLPEGWQNRHVDVPMLICTSSMHPS